MGTRVADRFDDWAERSFAGGYRGLQELADRGFSGVVRAGGAELYMTRGVAVGIRRGSIEDFADGGTAREAPSPALALLGLMQERATEVRDRFYSEQTPLSDVDETLADGGFTGYVELSENVLSGDYYLVYHRGRSMAVGFLGNAGRLVDGDEAFESAADEVGIYEVRAADIDRIELPEPPEPDPQTQTDPDTETTTPDGVSGETTDTTDPATDGDPDDDSDPLAAGEATTDTTGDDTDGDPLEPTEAASDETDGDPLAAEGESGGQTGGATTDTTGDETDGDPLAAGGESAGATEESTTDTTGDETDDDPLEPTEAASDETDGDPLEPTEAASDETDGDPLAAGGNSRAENDAATGEEGTPAAVAVSDESTDRDTESEAVALERQAIPSLDPARTSGEAETSATDESDGTDGTDRSPAELAAALDDREAELERVTSALADTREERDALREERDALREELESVRAERDRLVAEVERLEAPADQTGDQFDRERPPDEALAGTDIFVRYESKGAATLDDARDGGVDREAVAGNLRLEKHAQFARDSLAVDGDPYAEFIEDRLEYRFVEWVVHDLLFEIRETGQQSALADLYDVVPKLDRAELAGTVETGDGEGGPTESFDVVFRNRIGDPLLVANLNASREPATERMTEEVTNAAERVGTAAEQLSGAFLVTQSFFEPAALEVAGEATRGGLLSRNKRRSFVKLGRKRGYHLCLVEARDGNFHLAVPDL